MPQYLISISWAPELLVVLFLLLGVVEYLHPLRRHKRARPRRWLVNLALTGLSFGVGVALVRPAALAASAWAQSQGFGMLPWSGLPFWVQFLLGFLWMDATFYYWHRANHIYPLLWRFHNVHHVDPDLDVTTSFRFHFGETAYSSIFRIVQVSLAGITPVIYLTYEIVFNLATMFHHSNVALPLIFERRLNKIMVTPRMHGIHHSAVGRETNSNYSVIFSWWDRLGRSLRLNVPQEQVVIGVPGYLLPRDNGLRSLIFLPFHHQRPYWRWPSGKASVRHEETQAASNYLMP
ncbi:MAG: sterol desaturase family protein [Syntrophales bacterium]|nr:sterol desaturase family protein [Syntrophales bacterium]